MTGPIIFPHPGGGKVVQTVYTQTGAVATGTTVIPFDDTIPQNTEGDEYMTLAITPKSGSNDLYVEVVFNGASSASDLTVALFRDSAANALAAVHTNVGVVLTQLVLRHRVASPGAGATTFKVRAGGAAAGTVTFNGAVGARKYGGVIPSSIRITEVAP